MFKKIPLDKYYRLINHGPCVLITSGPKTNPNIAPIAWNMPLNDEPPLAVIAVAETHYTTKLISKVGEFVINVAGKDLLPAIMYAGSKSGKKVNKIKELGLKIEPGTKVAIPHLAKAAGYIECKVIRRYAFDGVILFVGRVRYAAVQDKLFDGYWISEKAKIVHHLGGSYFACLGKRFNA